MSPPRLLLALAALAAPPALAQSSAAAAWLLDAELAEACGGPGAIDPAALIERDLTGDGRADLVIAHEGIRCGHGGRSGFCGAELCAFNVWVRTGDLLEPAAQMLGLEVRVAPDGTLHWSGLGGAPRSMRWTGARFE